MKGEDLDRRKIHLRQRGDGKQPVREDARQQQRRHQERGGDGAQDEQAWDRSEQVRLAAGMLQTMDNQIDLATGTLKLKAEFANADDRLFPNQFVNVRLRVRTIQDAIVIPGAAVQFGSRGTYVFPPAPSMRRASSATASA